MWPSNHSPTSFADNRSGNAGYLQSTSEPSVSTKSLFIGDLSFFCTEIDLGPLFAKFGGLKSLEIKRGRHGDSLMHGFVEYELESTAQMAITELNGRKFMGRCMRVNWTNMKAESARNMDNLVQMHVNFLTPDLSKKVTEEFIESVFIQYGQIGDVAVKRHLCSYQPPQVTGYAFVYFFDTYAALRAVHGLKGVNIDGVIFECCLSYKAEQSLREQTGMEAVLKSVQPAHTGSFFKRFGTQNSSSPGSAVNISSPQALYTSPANGYRPFLGKGGLVAFQGHPHHSNDRSEMHSNHFGAQQASAAYGSGQPRQLTVAPVPYRSMDRYPPQEAAYPSDRHSGPSLRNAAGYIQQQSFYQQQKLPAAPYHHAQGSPHVAGGGRHIFSHPQQQENAYRSAIPNLNTIGLPSPPAPRMSSPPTNAMGYSGLPSPGAATFIQEGFMNESRDWSASSQSPSSRSRFGSSAYGLDDFGVIGIPTTRSSQSSESLRYAHSLSLESMTLKETTASPLDSSKIIGFQSAPVDSNRGLLFDYSFLQDIQQQEQRVIAPHSSPVTDDLPLSGAAHAPFGK